MAPPPIDITSHLPLQLIKSETIPPAPTRSESGSTADFLLDFAGHSWIAYAASPLLVISHFPNPLSEAETKAGPIFQQVLELSTNDDIWFSGVSWSPATPSVGELAAAWDGRIALFSYDEDEASSSSSFCWSQTAVLEQSTKVEAVKWTTSGDGIISGGIEVVMWRRKEKSWEIAWKFTPKVPQTLVSTTWSANGFSATAPWSTLQTIPSYSPKNEAGRCVLVFQGDGHSKYPLAELHHPMPVQVIQWRPSTGKPSSEHARHALRPILLTCCLDGTVRLWSDIDDGRIRRTGKDSSDQKAMNPSFCVVAVIEVNQTLNGFLGSDIFISWATEVEGVAIIDKEACYYSCLDDLKHDTAGRCEWIIGFGPKKVTSLWAVHCLDDCAPVRFPRVTLWKKQELASFETEPSQILLDKVLIMRNRVFGPPVLCSIIYLLPSNSFSWTQLYSHSSSSMEGNSSSESNTESLLTSNVNGILKVDGHTGKILQLAIHPSFLKVGLAATLDTNGIIIFWSCSSFYGTHIGLPVSTPSWKLWGKTSVSDHHPNYTCLGWASMVLGEDRILLMGHNDGIDCFIFKTAKNGEEKIQFHNIFSVPFRIEGPTSRLSKVCSIPLPSNCNGNFISSKFLLVALWMDGFQALSWEITIHCYDSEGIYCDKHLQTFESGFSSKKYSVSIEPYSSVFPAPHNDDKVTSCAVVCPIDLALSVEQEQNSADETGSCPYAYHMVTGCMNGSLKLWRSLPARSLSSAVNWDLVGVLTSSHGPIMEVSPSACCGKIATASATTIYIWGCMQVQSAGSFMLEDKLCFDGEIVALNWLVLGNGQLILGVCLQNELLVYAPRRCGGEDILKYEKPAEESAWICIAAKRGLPAISNFHWGPKGMVMVVHDTYFSLFSNFLLVADNNCLAKCCQKNPKESPTKISGRLPQIEHYSKMNTKDSRKSTVNIESCQQTDTSSTKISFWSMSEIAEEIGGSLPLFHPEALLNNIFSGKWKRAVGALRHLVKHLSSSNSLKGCRNNILRNMLTPVPLSNYFEGLASPNSSEKLFRWSSSQVETELSRFAPFGGDVPKTALTSSSSKSEFTDFVEAIGRMYDSTYITKVEKMQALALIDLLQEVSNPHSTSAYGSLDEPGRRFWVAIRFQKLYLAQRFSRPPVVEELVATSSMIGWAFHSDCHDNLFNSLLTQEPYWEEMRSMGVGFWYTNVTQLRVKMERLARQKYMKNKDPKACTLLYIALKRIQVLAGLFKISKDEKDKPLAGFLCRNFQEDNNKSAALKNAYVLMGQHKLELAIAFFLLGGDASSAVTVCAKNLGDEQLALVICRLLEGYGGPLECNIISKFLLPSALSKGDFWKASFLEWVLGNYSRSFSRMLGIEMVPTIDISLLSSHSSFMDPSIGQYCLMLAMKTNMKNAIGEYNAAVLCGWAALMNVTSFSRCGLPLEALECLSSSVSLFGGPAQGSSMHYPNSEIIEMLNPSVNGTSSNWISDKISYHIISQSKLYLAMQYMTKLIREHPSNIDISEPSYGLSTNHEAKGEGFTKLLKEFQGNLTAAIEYFQQKFFLTPRQLISMIVLSLHHNGLEFIGHFILKENISEFQLQGSDNLLLHPSNLLSKATEEISSVFLKYVFASCKLCFHSTYFSRNGLARKGKFCWLTAWGSSNQGIAWSFGHLAAMFQLYLGSCPNDSSKLLHSILGLIGYNVIFASAWLQRNFKALFLVVRPIMVSVMSGNTAYEIKIEDLNKLHTEIGEMHALSSASAELGKDFLMNEQEEEQHADNINTFPEDKRWQVMCASLWVHMSQFLEHQLNKLLEDLDDKPPSPSRPATEPDYIKPDLQVRLVLSSTLELVKLACADISFYCSQWFATYLLREVTMSNQTDPFNLADSLSQGGGDKFQMIESVKLLSNCDKLLDLERLCCICADPKIVRAAFWEEYRNWLSYFQKKSSSGWRGAYISITREFGSEEIGDREDKHDSPSRASGSPMTCLSPDDHPFKSPGHKDLDSKRAIPFHNPKDVHKRNGELLEALCINSIDQCQAGLASNKKGIIFFNWEDEIPQKEKSEYIWGEADWPHNGWAGSESIPVPTCVSPGVGLGSKKGAHLGLGGATVGAGALVRPGKGLIGGGGGFGISGSAGLGGSGLGWGVQEGFEEFVDSPATVYNVRTRAFASHPSMPLFLVGSSNTHIYLWEFGKDTATATYGVLPAANVPPPYALASVSAVRFDRCGHRFVNAASDGTVCTWQLEVGGRSNVRPTESSVCFNNHTSDVTYVTASGSIVAAAGHSSSGVNVVVWDTLAPPATSRASIMCHEGGACSLSVFDNDIGSGSISPLILTGGINGDVGLHDFRYIATGRTKRHKQSDTVDHNFNASSSSVDMRSKTGDQNRNGMIWYIPRAHSGSVTKISTIPNTSFFLTGSKDGDVKLWDAKRAKLVYHWPRLHERHTFLQPSGFGGVSRAGVTDIQVVSHGFLTCGGDGSVKYVRFRDFPDLTTK